MTAWQPSSWRDHPADQMPDWPDQDALAAAESHLRSMPPLVFAGEARRLREGLAEVAEGRAFVLQAGDCAESFSELSADNIRDKLKVILQMALVLTYSAGVPVIKIGRMAGQFAKPRSEAREVRDGKSLPSYRGDIINGAEFNEQSRTPDPGRLIQAYQHSAVTLNLVRAFTRGGFADLARSHAWNQEFVSSSNEGARYNEIAVEIERALQFMQACGIDLVNQRQLHEVDFYASHEALLLPFEEAMTRRDSLTQAWVDTSAHLLWIGERTRKIDGAHVEFLSGVLNPVACKVGPSCSPQDLVALCDRLNPQRVAGRMSVITRFGAGKIEAVLPPLIEAVRHSGHPVVWICDAMHGNTRLSSSGRKTRHFDDLLHEIRCFFDIHRSLGTWPGGVHLELTGDDVTECLGGAEEVLEHNLEENYLTACDPRLNVRQSLDLAFQIAELLRQQSTPLRFDTSPIS